MKNNDKTEEQLLQEINELQTKIAISKNAETKWQKTEEKLKAANQQLTSNEQQLRAANQQLEANNQQLIASEKEIKRHAHDLGERVKELNCLYSISKIVEIPDISLDEIVQRIVNIIPSAGQYPEKICAKIILLEKEFKTENFKESKWKHTCDIKINRKRVGKVEVCYLEQIPDSDEGPFLKEEKILLDSITERLGRIAERKQAEQQLKAANQQLTANEQQLRASNQQLTSSEQQLRAANQQLTSNEQQLRAANQQLTSNEQQLRAANQQLEANNQQLIASEKEIKRHAHDLGERVKELDCLFGIAKSIRTRETIEEILQDTANIIPPAWHYPEITRGKVCFDGKEYVSQTFKESKWKQSTDIIVNRKKRGTIEVYYLEECPELDEGPFMKEERNLIDSIAKTISEAIERKQVEEELRESEKRYKQIYQFSPDPIIIHDMDMNILDANNKAVEEFGYPKEELLEMKVFDLHPETELKHSAQVLDAMKKKEMMMVETEFLRKDGSVFLAEATPCKYTLGSKPIIHVVIRDITERKQAEDKLKNSEREKSVILDSSPTLIAYQNMEHEIIWANQTACDSVNKKVDELIGRKCHEIWEGKKEVCKGCPVEEAWKTRKIVRGEHTTSDGRCWSIIGSPVIDGQGKIIGAVETSLDITERKQGEEESKSSEERLKILFESAPDAIYLSDLKGTFIDGNRAAEDLMGYKKEELVGKSFLKLKLLSGKELLKASKLLLKNLQGKGTGPDELILNRKDGSQVTVEILTYPVKIKDKTMVMGIARDITDRKRAEVALREKSLNLNERVKELNCLYEISNLVQTPVISDDDFFQEVVDLIPSGFRYRKITVCCLIVNEKEYKTRNFTKTDWNICKDIIVEKRISGSIEVYQLKKLPDLVNGQFLKEEKDLIKAIAERLGHIIELKQAEKELREREIQFRALFENMSNGVAVYEAVNNGADFIFKDFNKAGERIDHIKKEDILGKSLLEIYPGVKKLGLYEIIQNVWQTSKPETLPDSFYEDNRISGWRENFVYKLPSGDIVSVFSDITERKQAEEALRVSLTKYKTLFDNFPMGITVADQNGKIVESNAMSEKLLGLSQKAQLEHKISGEEWRIVRPDGTPMPAEEYASVRALKEKCLVENVEMGIVKAEGNITWISVNAIPLSIENYGLVITYSDITDRKQAEKIKETLFNISSALNVNDEMHMLYSKIRAFLGEIVDTTNFYIVLYDKENESISFEYYEDETFDRKGYLPAGRKFSKGLTEYVISSSKPLLATKQKQDELAKQGKIEVIGARSEIWLGAPLKVENQVIGALAVQSYDDPNLYSEKDIEILTFISEEIAIAIKHKQDEGEILKSHEELKELHKNLQKKVDNTIEELRDKDHILIQQSRHAAMGEMIGNIAHQWRQPLQAIAGIIQNYEDAYGDGTLDMAYIEKHTDLIMDILTDMSRTIDDFRYFFKPNKIRENFNIKDVILKTLKFLESSFKFNNIDVSLDLEDNCIIEGFTNEYSQVLLVIFSNAKDELIELQIKAKQITIVLNKIEDKFVVQISDNAGGITKEVLPKVFDPYFTTKEQGKGTGVGLYMAKMIIEKNMDGKLTARNLKDGAEFRIEV